MRRFALASIATVLLLAASLAWAAAAKQYQFTGVVKDVAGGILSVDKGGEIWQFSLESLPNPAVKKGDKVTVYYKMVASKVEPKK